MKQLLQGLLYGLLVSVLIFSCCSTVGNTSSGAALPSLHSDGKGSQRCTLASRHAPYRLASGTWQGWAAGAVIVMYASVYATALAALTPKL